jgi:predicted transcriptional regulator
MSNKQTVLALMKDGKARTAEDVGKAVGITTSQASNSIKALVIDCKISRIGDRQQEGPISYILTPVAPPRELRSIFTLGPLRTERTIRREVYQAPGCQIRSSFDGVLA